eukprot:4312273-Pleurochrysis_carterae.AAC.2
MPPNLEYTPPTFRHVAPPSWYLRARVGAGIHAHCRCTFSSRFRDCVHWPAWRHRSMLRRSGVGGCGGGCGGGSLDKHIYLLKKGSGRGCERLTRAWGRGLGW